LAIGLAVRDNSVMANLDAFLKGPFTNDPKIDRTTIDYVEKINIKTPSVSQLVVNLSGGNQQKIVVAKWLIETAMF
jgi:ribose transport system ATP-binding protein